MRWHVATTAERRSRSNRWRMIFAWLPHRLWEYEDMTASAFEDDRLRGRRHHKTTEVVWLERIAKRCRDGDSRAPYHYGPPGYVVSQPGVRK